MSVVRHGLCISIAIFFLTAIAICEEPVHVTVCQLKSDPPSYNHKIVEVTGFVSHAFEDFSLSDPSCPSWPGVWLEYGGKSQSGTVYCCGGAGERSRPKELVVENIPVPLVKNQRFEEFDRAIQPPFRSGRNGAVVHATILGRFFAGQEVQNPHGKMWGGYGHMGCCSLLAIQEIKLADTKNREGLDYGAALDQPDMNKVGCGYTDLLPLERAEANLRWQEEADTGKNSWAFENPERVASETLSRLKHFDDASLAKLKIARKSQGREVYQLKLPDRPESYLVVLSRPYWLSFYSRDPNRVAWVAIAAYESSCRQRNSVTRIK